MKGTDRRRGKGCGSGPGRPQFTHWGLGVLSNRRCWKFSQLEPALLHELSRRRIVLILVICGKKCPAAALSGLQSMRPVVRGTHSRVPRGMMGTFPILVLRTRVRGGFPIGQNPEAQELEVSESFWGAQSQAEGVRWTRLLQSYPHPSPQPSSPWHCLFLFLKILLSFCGGTSPPTVS